MKTAKIIPGETPIRYTFATAREATNTYNRIVGLFSVSLLSTQQRLLPHQIVNGPIKNGDPDAIVCFLWAGWRHVNRDLEQADVEKLLDSYLRSPERGGQGGGLVDFYAPIRDALIECGVVEPDARDLEEEASPRPATAPFASGG